MKIQVFALLKEYFHGEFELASAPNTISALKEQLTGLKPEAKDVLELSRFAVNDEFVDTTNSLTEDDNVFVIPPSSGG